VLLFASLYTHEIGTPTSLLKMMKWLAAFHL